jgi:hypothetical protein
MHRLFLLLLIVAIALVAFAGPAVAGPFGILGGRGGMDCNVRAREEGPKQANAENLRETPAPTTALLKPEVHKKLETPPAQLAKRGKSGANMSALAKLNSSPTTGAATVAAK